MLRIGCGFCSVAKSCRTLQLHRLQYVRLYPPLSPGVCSNLCPLSQWCYPTILSSRPLLLLPSIFPSMSLSQWVSSSHQMAKVLAFQLQHQSFQWIFRIDFLYDWLVWSPCCPRDSQEFSPAPQFGSMNSLVLSLLYGPTLTSIYDYLKNSSDNTHLFWQTDVSAF